jgi:hypothetical protein
MAMVSDGKWFRTWTGYCTGCDILIGLQFKERIEKDPPHATCPNCGNPLSFSGEMGFCVRDQGIWLKFRRFETRKKIDNSSKTPA